MAGNARIRVRGRALVRGSKAKLEEEKGGRAKHDASDPGLRHETRNQLDVVQAGLADRHFTRGTGSR